ncbi:MAG: hypothetical protein M9894_29100 [Planctomycetes bacterium]|nr:hypothetical protein [Planctomycetota bacterium]
MDPNDADLARAAASLQAELEKKTARLRRPGAPTFRPAAPPTDAAFVALDEALGRDAVLVACVTCDAAPGVVLRAGVLRDGFTLALVVAPSDRPPYVELSTFLARPPRPDREVVTTNARPDPAPPRPAHAALERLPGRSPQELRRRHHERLAALTGAPGDDDPVRLWIEPTEQAVLRALGDYLRLVAP